MGQGAEARYPPGTGGRSIHDNCCFSTVSPSGQSESRGSWCGAEGRTPGRTPVSTATGNPTQRSERGRAAGQGAGFECCSMRSQRQPCPSASAPSNLLIRSRSMRKPVNVGIFSKSTSVVSLGSSAITTSYSGTSRREDSHSTSHDMRCSKHFTFCASHYDPMRWLLVRMPGYRLRNRGTEKLRNSMTKSEG